MAADTAESPEEQLRALQKEAAALRQRLEEERQKLNDVSLANVAERLEPITFPNLKPRRVLKGHQAKVLCCDWSPDRRRLVSSAQDGKLLLWDAFCASRDAAPALPTAWLMACAFAPTGRAVAAGGLDNKLTLVALDEQGGGTRRVVGTAPAYVAALAFPGTERQLLAAGGGGGAALWDTETGARLARWTAHAADALALDADAGAGRGDVFATGGADRTLRVWDARTPRAVAGFPEHGSDVAGVRFHPSGDAVASACDDAALRVFDLRADRELARLERESLLFGAASLDWSPSGRLLFAGYGDHTAAAWDALRATRVCVLCGHEHRVSRVRVSPDGTALATASWDATIRVWA